MTLGSMTILLSHRKLIILSGALWKNTRLVEMLPIYPRIRLLLTLPAVMGILIRMLLVCI